MKKIALPLTVTLLALPAMALSSNTAPLFVGAERIEFLRQEIHKKNSTAKDMLRGMEIRHSQGWDDGYRPGFSPGRRTYQGAWYAREAAFLFLLKKDPAYLKRAIRELRDGVGNAGTTGRGLNDAQHSVAFACVYAWGKTAMDEADRDWIEAKMREALDHWPGVSHPNFGADRGSNWVSVSRGGELILLLASPDQEERKDRRDFLVNELARHIASALGTTGYTQEGVGYNSYGGAFLYPAAIALNEVTGEDTLVRMLQQRNVWEYPMFAGATGAGGNRGFQSFLPSGVSGIDFMDEGWVSAILGIVPDEVMPFYKYFYDRHAGPLNQRKVEFKYDSTRAGTPFAMLFYPFNEPGRDPAQIYGHMLADERGYYFFRNRWKDGNDIMTSIMADANSHPRAWDQPEALQLTLLAFDNNFLSTPGKEREPHLYSTLLVNGERGRTDKNQQHLRGERLLHEASNRGGYVIVGGGELYQESGVDKIRRHYLVDFPEADGAGAILSTLDQMEAGQPNTYTWNAAIATHEGGGEIQLTIGAEGGRPTFLMEGKNNGYLKGWVLHPSDVRVESGANGQGLQIHTDGENKQVWIVMTVGQDRPPEAQISGEGMESLWLSDSATVRYDPSADRIIHTIHSAE